MSIFMVFSFFRWAFRSVIILAIFFIALHHPKVQSWALGNRFLRPFAVELLKLPKDPKTWTKELRKRALQEPATAEPAPAEKTEAKTILKEVATEPLPPAKKSPVVVVPAVDHLSRDDRKALRNELKRLRTQSRKKVAKD